MDDKNSSKKKFEPFSGDKIPNPIVLLGIGLFHILFLSILSTIGIAIINFLLSGFNLSYSFSIIKYCLSLIFFILLCSIPIFGIYFLVNFPLYSMTIVGLLKLQAGIGLWIGFIILYIIAIGAYLFNTKGQILLWFEEYTDLHLKKLNRILTIVVYSISILIGIIMIFLANSIFSMIFSIISGI